MSILIKKRSKLSKKFKDEKKAPGLTDKQRRENRRRIKRQMTKLERQNNRVSKRDFSE